MLLWETIPRYPYEGRLQSAEEEVFCYPLSRLYRGQEKKGFGRDRGRDRT